MNRTYISIFIAAFVLAVTPFTTSALTATATSADVSVSQSVADKKATLKAKLDAKKAAIQDRLAGRRLAKCQKKQITINRILDNRTESYQKHLEKFNAVRDRLVTFVADKQLSGNSYASLEAAMNTKRADATASVEVLLSTEFKCEDTEAARPGSIARDSVRETRQSLKDYRSAIKDYAKAVKADPKVSTGNESEAQR